MKQIVVEDNRIQLLFPYSEGMIARIKEELPDYSWYKTGHYWWVPATRFHAQKIMEFAAHYGFVMPPELGDLAMVQDAPVDLPNLPEHTTAALYPYQKEAIYFLLHARGRAILADDMGLGKTIECLAYLTTAKIGHTLVVCPATVTYKWEDEIHKWMPEADCQIVKKGTDKIDYNKRFLIMSYGMLVSKAEELHTHTFDCIVYDEIHAINNPATARYKAAKSMKATKLIGLSGTPFLNRPIEMQSTLALISPLAWGNRWRYANRYCNAYQDGFGWNFDGHSNEEELSERIKDTLLRRTKADVAFQLPELTRSVLMVSSDKSEYNEMLEKGINDTGDLFRLKHEIGRAKAKPAAELALDILQGEGSKVVIFAHHQDVIEKIMALLAREGHNCLHILGSDSQSQRAEAAKKFQKDGGERVIIISEAGGEGIDLFRSQYLIMAERCWNPGKEEQIEARLHRIGQSNAVTAYYLIWKETIDEEIHELIEDKRNVFKQIIGSQDIDTNIQNVLVERMKNYVSTHKVKSAG